MAWSLCTRAVSVLYLFWKGKMIANGNCCCLPRVQLFVSTCNGRPHLALLHHWLLSINRSRRPTYHRVKTFCRLLKCLSTDNDIHRPRQVFQSGVGVKLGWWRTGALLHRTPCWGWVRKGAAPPALGVGLSPPEIFGNFVCKMGHFWGKIAILIPNKGQFWPKLLVTNGSVKLHNESYSSSTLLCSVWVGQVNNSWMCV